MSRVDAARAERNRSNKGARDIGHLLAPVRGMVASHGVVTPREMAIAALIEAAPPLTPAQQAVLAGLLVRSANGAGE